MALSNGLQLRLLVAEVAALFCVVTLIFGHALLLRWRARRDGPRLACARAALVATLNQEARDRSTLDGQLRRDVARVSSQQQVNLFAGLAASLEGGQRATLTALAAELGLIARAEQDCRSRLWWRRLHGCRVLTLIGGGDAVVPALLNDPQTDVHAQAVEWAASHPQPTIVTALLAQLAIPTDLCRYSVQDSLLRLGGAAVEPLADYLATHSGRSVEAALEVAIGLADPRLLEPALTLCHDTVPRVRALATAVIGALGGEATEQTLMGLLCDPADEVRAAAAEALAHLDYRPAAPALALRLRDHSWGVRRAAGLALCEFGAPGLLYLRRALTDADPYAADMARQLLDLSALTGEAP